LHIKIEKAKKPKTDVLLLWVASLIGIYRFSGSLALCYCYCVIL